MFEAIHEFPIVNFLVIKIKESLVKEVLLDRKTIIDTVFKLFNRWIFDNYVTR